MPASFISSYKTLLSNAIKKYGRNSGTKRFAFNTGILFFEQIVRLAVGLIVGVWVAKFLGPAQFGLLSYAQSLVGLLGALATLGLNSIVVREVIKFEAARNEIVGTAFVLKILGGSMSLILLGVSVVMFNVDYTTKLVVLLVGSSTIFQSFNVIDFYFQSKLLSKYVVYVNFVVLGVSSAMKLYGIFADLSIVYFAVIFIVESLVLAAGLIYFYQVNREDVRKWRFSRIIALGLLRDGWPLILSSISISIGMRIDQVMIKSMLPNESSLGFYAVGVRLAELFNFIPLIICQTLFPRLIVMDFRRDSSVLVKIFRIGFYVLVLLAIMVNVSSYYLVKLIYGSEYLPSVIVLNILIWSIPITFLNILTSSILQAGNSNKVILYRQLLLAAVNVIINLIFIPKYGIAGASLATLLADSSIIIFGYFVAKEKWIFFVRVRAILFVSFKNKHSNPSSL